MHGGARIGGPIQCGRPAIEVRPQRESEGKRKSGQLQGRRTGQVRGSRLQIGTKQLRIQKNLKVITDSLMVVAQVAPSTTTSAFGNRGFKKYEYGYLRPYKRRLQSQRTTTQVLGRLVVVVPCNEQTHIDLGSVDTHRRSNDQHPSGDGASPRRCASHHTRAACQHREQGSGRRRPGLAHSS